jgi:hypothetical protein
MEMSAQSRQAEGGEGEREREGRKRKDELIRSKHPFEVGFRLFDRTLTYLVR